MKKPTKIAVIVSSATAVFVVAAITITLIVPKFFTQTAGSASKRDRVSNATVEKNESSAEKSSRKKKTKTKTGSRTVAGNHTDTGKTGTGSAKKTATASRRNISGGSDGTFDDPMFYTVTARFSVPSNDVFTFPNFAKKTYIDNATGKHVPYRLYLPENYNKNKKYPVFFFLHGAGERGSDNSRHINTLKQSYKVAGDLLGQAIVLAPQCPSAGWWYLDEGSGNESGWLGAAMRLLRTTMSEYSCDKNRVYVAGLSMGGYATWSVLERHGDMFAAGVPICGWGNSSMGSTLAKIPIWVYHSIDDPTVSYSRSQEMVNAIKNAGGHMVQFTSLNGVGHNAWDTALGTRKTFLWMFGQTKSKGLAGDDSYKASHFFRVISPKGSSVITEEDVECVSEEYDGKSTYLIAYLTPEGGKRLRNACASNSGKEFTVEYLGQPYYRFRPSGKPQEDEFVFAPFAKDNFQRLLQHIG